MDEVLRLNPIQIAEWLEEIGRSILAAPCDRAITLATEYHVSKSHVRHYLGLLRIPVDLRTRLKLLPGMTEGELRRLVRLEPIAQRVAIHRLLGLGLVAKAG